MRFANQKCQRWSPAKQYNNNATSSTRKNINLRIDLQKTFMHYNNAIYMGNMVSYKRNGQGVMLYDEGTSAIVDYNFDTLVGHNVFFGEDVIASVLYIKRGSYEIVMRTSHFIFKLPFYESQNLPNGNGVLIDFKELKIYHLIYQCGKLVRKVVQSNKDVINNVSKQRLKQLIDVKHEQVFKFQWKSSNGIKVWKQKDRIIFGYFDNQNNLDGVCFKLQVNQSYYDNFEIDLQLKCVERGFYKRGRLQNFGQRYFPNGNLYIGSFLNDSFQGKGLLVYPSEQKWVYGQFEKQKLKKMIETSVGSDRQLISKTSMKSCLKNIHELNMNNWMNVKIQSLKWSKIFLQLKNADYLMTTDVVVEKQRIKRQEQQRLSNIQRYFSGHNRNKDINKILMTQKDLNGVSPQKLILNQYNSFKKKVIDIQPRTLENQCYWSIQKSPKSISITPKCQNKFNKMQTFQSSIRQNYQNSRSNLSPFKSSSRLSKKQISDLSNSVQY